MTNEREQPEPETEYDIANAPQSPHAGRPMTEEEMAALPPQEDGPAPLTIPDEAPEGWEPPTRYGLVQSIEGDPPGLPESSHVQDDRGVEAVYAVGDTPVLGAVPESTNPLSKQEGLDGSKSLVHLFQEIPGDTEIQRNLLYGTIQFQHGPVAEVGVNGGTIEGVVQALKARLEGFQRGELACTENQQAIVSFQHVLNALAHRTRVRMEQGIEGTNQPHEEL